MNSFETYKYFYYLNKFLSKKILSKLDNEKPIYVNKI